MQTEYRGYLIKTHKRFPQCLEIARPGQGGSVPNELTGMFTDTASAFTAVDQVEDHKPKRGKSSAKAKSNG